jgi:hypothetical protein
LHATSSSSNGDLVKLLTDYWKNIGIKVFANLARQVYHEQIFVRLIQLSARGPGLALSQICRIRLINRPLRKTFHQENLARA